jgi:uncharacterized lipoprotein YajG
MNRTIKRRALTGPALCLLTAGIVLAGCASSEDESTTTDGPPATTTTSIAATATTAAASTETCVDCHTDETALQALAVEPPETELLSEGEG